MTSGTAGEKIIGTKLEGGGKEEQESMKTCIRLGSEGRVAKSPSIRLASGFKSASSPCKTDGKNRLDFCHADVIEAEFQGVFLVCKNTDYVHQREGTLSFQHEHISRCCWCMKGPPQKNTCKPLSLNTVNSA